MRTLADVGLDGLQSLPQPEPVREHRGIVHREHETVAFAMLLHHSREQPAHRRTVPHVQEDLHQQSRRHADQQVRRETHRHRHDEHGEVLGTDGQVRTNSRGDARRRPTTISIAASAGNGMWCSTPGSDERREQQKPVAGIGPGRGRAVVDVGLAPDDLRDHRQTAKRCGDDVGSAGASRSRSRLLDAAAGIDAIDGRDAEQRLDRARPARTRHVLDRAPRRPARSRATPSPARAMPAGAPVAAFLAWCWNPNARPSGTATASTTSCTGTSGPPA